jgi:16S rRNA (adenine1518-N6/adenine1519-N6)-dimethyltransferase
MAHSELATPSATVSVLRRHGLWTKKSLGQHFLVDDNVVGRIIALAALTGEEHVLEVGPGIGTLTLALCAAAGEVTAVERDGRLLGILGEMAERCGNLRVVAGDALEITEADFDGPSGQPTLLVANLPYSVAATLVLRFFEILPSLQSATVMVQAEVADRMMAVPGTKEYGSYTIKLALRARHAGRFSVAPTCFLPPPRVDSAVLRLERLESTAPEEAIVRAARAADASFAQRRKTLRNSLSSALGVPAVDVEAVLAAIGIDAGLRAETLPPESFLAIGAELHKHGLLP